MVFAMVLGGLRRCEVLGLTLGDIQVPERSLFVAEGKGGHQRVIPISNTFLAAVGDYLHSERPRDAATDRVFRGDLVAEACARCDGLGRPRSSNEFDGAYGGCLVFRQALRTSW